MMATITCSHQKQKQSPQVRFVLTWKILFLCPDFGGTHLDGPDRSLPIHPENQLPVAQTHHRANLSYVGNLDIIIHIKNTLKWTKEAEFNCLPANLSILDGPTVPLAVNTSKPKKSESSWPT